MKYAITILIMGLASISVLAQEKKFTLPELIDMALERNPSVQESALQVTRQAALKGSSFEIPKTDVSFLRGQYNSIQNNDNNITISQMLPFPTLLGAQHTLNRMYVRQAELKEHVTRNELTFQVKANVNQFLYLRARRHALLKQDSLITNLTRIAELQYKTGEGTLIAKTSAETQRAEMRNQLARNEADLQATLKHLQLLCQSPLVLDVAGDLETLMEIVELDSSLFRMNPALALAGQQVNIMRQQKKIEVSRSLPDFHFGYFNQTLIGNQNVNGQEVYFGPSKRFQGIQVGLTFPLWFAPYASRIKAADMETQVAQKQKEAAELLLASQYTQATQELIKNRNSLEYLRSSALATADLLSRQSQKSFESGELDYSVFLLNLRQALTIREEYLTALFQYNYSVITLQYLNGNK